MRCCFIVQRWQDNLVIEKMQLHLVSYWIQAHGILINLMTTGNAKEIGEKPGTFVKLRIVCGRALRASFAFVFRLIPDFLFPLASGCLDVKA